MLLTVNSNIHNVCSCGRNGEHCRNRDTGSIMRMDVDREIRVLLTVCTDQTVRL